MTEKITFRMYQNKQNKTIWQKKRTYREIGTRFALPADEVEKRLKKTRNKNKKGV